AVSKRDWVDSKISQPRPMWIQFDISTTASQQAAKPILTGEVQPMDKAISTAKKKWTGFISKGISCNPRL
ncbi:MAG: hypothetical protein VX704_08635, partial [Verrucomicrobiota bacterium]|nr:hypothetical protein [Verrucomicrobiota bacterium]